MSALNWFKGAKDSDEALLSVGLVVRLQLRLLTIIQSLAQS
jgi:hypothetical protein